MKVAVVGLVGRTRTTSSAQGGEVSAQAQGSPDGSTAGSANNVTGECGPGSVRRGLTVPSDIQNP